MSKTTYITCYLCLCVLSLFGQHDRIDISPYIDAWKVKDHTQSFRFEETLVFFTTAHFIETPYSAKHQQVIDAAKIHLQHKPDKRLSVRLLMYETLAREFNTLEGVTEMRERLLEAIGISEELKDKHLLSELYMLYARYQHENPEFIIYTIRSLKIQEEIGIEKFPRHANALFDLCLALYHTNDFDRSIIYGKKFIDTHSSTPYSLIDQNAYFYMLDLLGANHLKIKDYEKAYDYHQRLLDTLEKGNRIDPDFRDSWLGIARGNVGQILFKQDHIQQSIPYLQSALDIAATRKIWNTAANAQHLLGQVDYRDGRYDTAINKWKEAYAWTFQSDMAVHEPLKLLRYQISGDIASAYYRLAQIDSAYHYQTRAHEEQMLYERGIHDKNFDLITTNLNFEEAQRSLEVSRQQLKNEKTLRNGIFVAIILSGIISLLVIHQRRQSAAYERQMLIQQRVIAEERAEEAKKNIETFKRNIAEKERLIEDFKKNAAQKQGDDTGQIHKLSEYILVTDEEWGRFKDDFSKAYPLFLTRLRDIITNPTPAEERLSCLLSLKLINTQIAAMLGISTDSVARSKRRLRHRITLQDHVSLEEHICSLHIP